MADDRATVMHDEDELDIPKVPEPAPGDPEDVAWALSTASAMWARGDHLEGIKWVRKAAEAASDAEKDGRALELAKAASELTTALARQSQVSLNPTPTSSNETAGHVSSTPPTLSAPGASTSAPPPLPPPGSPPATPPAAVLTVAPQALQSPFPPRAARVAPRPLATGEARTNSLPRGATVGRKSTDSPPKTTRARPPSDPVAPSDLSEPAPGVPGPHPVTEGTARNGQVLGDTSQPVSEMGRPTAIPAAAVSRNPEDLPPPDPTTRLDSAVIAERRQKSAAEWDASPTQNLSGALLDQELNIGERTTAALGFPAARPSVPPPAAARPRPTTVHDPQIQTSQAVRVVVWQDATGVHIAPAGKVVSAITIDAMLVALEPSADLTAWLSKRER